MPSSRNSIAHASASCPSTQLSLAPVSSSSASPKRHNVQVHHGQTSSNAIRSPLTRIAAAASSSFSTAASSSSTSSTSSSAFSSSTSATSHIAAVTATTAVDSGGSLPRPSSSSSSAVISSHHGPSSALAAPHLPTFHHIRGESSSNPLHTMSPPSLLRKASSMDEISKFQIHAEPDSAGHSPAAAPRMMEDTETASQRRGGEAAESGGGGEKGAGAGEVAQIIDTNTDVGSSSDIGTTVLPSSNVPTNTADTSSISSSPSPSSPSFSSSSQVLLQLKSTVAVPAAAVAPCASARNNGSVNAVSNSNLLHRQPSITGRSEGEDHDHDIPTVHGDSDSEEKGEEDENNGNQQRLGFQEVEVMLD